MHKTDTKGPRSRGGITKSEQHYPTERTGAGAGLSRNLPICKYYQTGSCKHGDQCRFAHSEAPELTTNGTSPNSIAASSQHSTTTATSLAVGSGASTATTLESTTDNGTATGSFSSSSSSTNTSTGTGISLVDEGPPRPGPGAAACVAAAATVAGERAGPHPVLQLVVLFGSDQRVVRYAREVQADLMEASIDVLLVSTLTNGEVIRTEHLAELIAASANVSEHLAVLGDRNMKNRTCQTKRNGRLVEVPVPELVTDIWRQHVRAHPPPPPLPAAVVQGRAPPEPAHLEALLDHYCSQRHIPERVAALRAQIAALPPAAGPADTQRAARQTKTQQAAIRLHQALRGALERVRGAVSLPPAGSRGVALPPGWRPPVTPGEPESAITMHAPLKDALLEALRGQLLPQVETAARELGTAPLWDAYLAQTRSSANPSGASGGKKKAANTPVPAAAAPLAASAASKSQPPATAGPVPPAPGDGSWSCSKCTFANASSADVCVMCETARPWVQQGKKHKERTAVPPTQPTVAKSEPSATPASLSARSAAPAVAPTVAAPPAFAKPAPLPASTPSSKPAANSAPLSTSSKPPTRAWQGKPEASASTAPSQVTAASSTSSTSNTSASNTGPAGTSSVSQGTQQQMQHQLQQLPAAAFAGTGLYYHGGSPWGVMGGWGAALGWPSPASGWGAFETPGVAPSPAAGPFMPAAYFAQPQPQLQPTTAEEEDSSVVLRPCCVCGREAALECNLCALAGFPTYFCSAQHQALVWQQHARTHAASAGT